MPDEPPLGMLRCDGQPARTTWSCRGLL